MKSEFLAIFLLTIVNFASSQTALCQFNRINSLYTCTATIINPNGLDNFTQVEGIHFGSETDADVERIVRNAASTSPNFPSVFCRQFVNTQSIVLDHIGLERIDQNSFLNCQNLGDLRLANNRINSIHEEAFIRNYNLSHLDLSNNQLVKLPESVFGKQINLNQLYLEVNLIQELPTYIFNALNQLNVLTLDLNQLNFFPNGIFDNLINLNRLSFTMNRLTSLNSNLIQNSFNLQFFSMGFNQITDIPTSFFVKNPSLTHIIVNGNNLRSLHFDSFGNRQNLNSFWLENNQIDAIDERIFGGQNLHFLTAGPNPCADRNGTITNPTDNEIGLALRRCFDNFNQLETTTAGVTQPTTTTKPNECEIGNVDERICRLEAENEELRGRIEKLERIIAGLIK